MRLPPLSWTLAAVGLSSGSVLAADPYMFVVVPDTQNYADFVNENNIYNKGQMNWIVANRTAMNIKFVMHLGDHQNPGNPYRTRTDNIYEPDFSKPVGNVNDKLAKWDRADQAIDILDAGGVPYSLVPGNHDYLNHDTKTEPYMYLKTFGPTRYTSSPKYDEQGSATYGGASPASSTFAWAGMNTYHRVYAGGYKWLNIALQADPDVNDLEWAQKIVNQNPNMPTIVTTHEYLNNSGYQHPEIFNKFVKNNPSIVMTFNGHITGEHRVAGTNIAGGTVQQMLVDYQADQFDAQFGADYYKGAGILRTVKVFPNTNTVTIKSYSPIADQYLTDADSQFSFGLDLPGKFGPADGAGAAGMKTFRNNLNGYTGTRDTIVSEANPGTNYGGETTAVLSNDYQGAKSRGLIKFESLFAAGAIPANAVIDSAELRFHTSATANSQSGSTIKVYRMLTGWNEDSVTWNSMTDGVTADGLEAILGENDAGSPTVAGATISFDVTESLAAWKAGAPNYGWMVHTNGIDNWKWDTSEGSVNGDHPSLIVHWRTPVGVVPEPAAIAMLGGLSALLPRRRRA